MAKCQITAIVEMEYRLVMNPIYSNAETAVVTHIGFNKQQVIDYYNSLLVEPYSEEEPDSFNNGTKKYLKTFKKGSPLEGFNPLQPNEWDKPGIFGHGIHEVPGRILQMVSVIPME